MILSSVVELRNQYADVDYECSLSQRTGERPLVRNVPDLLAKWPGGLKPKTAAARTVMHAMRQMLLCCTYAVCGVLDTPPSRMRGLKVIVSEPLLRLDICQSFDTNSIG